MPKVNGVNFSLITLLLPSVFTDVADDDVESEGLRHGVCDGVHVNGLTSVLPARVGGSWVLVHALHRSHRHTQI